MLLEIIVVNGRPVMGPYTFTLGKTPVLRFCP
jgi:hypothetical protein